MSSYSRYKYEVPYEDYAASTIETQNQKKIKKSPAQSKRKNKKINIFKILILLVLAVFIFKPVCTRVYDYTFINAVKNAAIKPDVNLLIAPSSNIFANSHLFGKNYVGKVNFKSPEMAQLELNEPMVTLQNNLQSVINAYPNLKVGVFVWDYQTKNYVAINAEEQIPAASIIKVPILLQMFKRIEGGELDLYEKFKMTSYYRTGGSGYLQYRPEGAVFEMNDLANYMIRTSDNTATNMILSAIGGTEEMNTALRNWGFSKTYIRTWLPDLYGTNVTTPKDMATILYNADNPKFLSLENRSRIVEIMSKVKNTSLLKQGIPDSALLIHKTGDIGEMLGDVGVVTMPNGRRYIITVMVKRRWNDYSARPLVNSISSIVYNSFASNNL